MLSNAEPAAGNIQASAAGTKRPVDLVHLAHHTMGDRELECEILDLFAKQSVLYLDRLRDARDERAWCEAAHTLKGSARSIGAWGVADTAEAAERMTGAVAARARSETVEKLAAQIDEANAFIRRVLADG